VAAQYEVWRELGPPPHIGIAIISAALGNKLTGDGSRSTATASTGSDDEFFALAGQLPTRRYVPPQLGLPTASA
jgi:hypothetical protein